MMTPFHVIPAQAGIQTPSLFFVQGWTPAFAGVTKIGAGAAL
jgi:hypothetical protein